MSTLPKYPGERITANGNQLVSYHTEARIADAGIFYPITPSTEGGELYQQSFAEGRLNVFGRNTLAVEAEGEHAAQGGAIAYSVCGRRVVNFTSGQGIVYGIEQYYHAPGKASTMVVEVVARALTKHALNVHCGHDDVYGALDVGWIILFGKDAQQAADQALILRRVTELSLTPGMNVQDGFLTSHLERTFYRHESELIREFLGAPDDVIECPTEAQRTLFGPTRRRVPRMIDLTNPVLLGPVQNQEHYMQGVAAPAQTTSSRPILTFLEEAHTEFGRLTGRHYGLVTQYKADDADTVFVSLGSAAENCEAAVDHLRQTRGAKVGSIHLNVFRPFPERAVVEALAGKKNAIIIERTDEPLAGDNPMGRDTRTALNKALKLSGHPVQAGFPEVTPDRMPRLFNGIYGLGSRDFRPEQIIGAYEYVTSGRTRTDGRTAADGESFMVLGVPHPYEVKADETPSLLPEGAIAVRFHSIGGWGAITTGKNLGAIIGDFNDFLSERSTDVDEYGRPKEVIHVSANPKYGSEKKGAPTSYFLVVAPERIRVNCDLRHVGVVLCCDPKAFTHCNPLEGISEGGALIWESDEEPKDAWERLPLWARTQIIEHKIRVYTLPGFDIARKATNRPDLQLPDAGQRVPRRLLLRLAAARGVRHQPRAVRRGRPQAVQKEVRPSRRRRRAVEHGGHDPGLRPGPRDPDRRDPGGGPVDVARAADSAAGGDADQRRRRGLRDLPLARAPGGPGGADAGHAGRQLRCRVPVRLRLRPAVLAAGRDGGDGGRQRRHGVEVRSPPRDPALHRRELHAVHGVHLGLPGHGAAELLAGHRHGSADSHHPTTSPTRASAAGCWPPSRRWSSRPARR